MPTSSFETTNLRISSEQKALALMFSILFHLLLFTLIPRPQQEAINKWATLQPLKLMLSTPIEQKKQQIVTTPEKSESKPIETNLLSEKNTSSTHEQIKRGEPAKPAQHSTSQPARSYPSSKSQPSSKRLPTQDTSSSQNDTQKTSATNLKPNALKSISLDENSLQKLLRKNENKKSLRKTLEDYKPFTKSAPSSIGFTGGSLDFLPQIPDGDITLLNTKAEKHAVFVRRVALQVFGALRKENWATVSFRDSIQVSRFAIVTATMDKQGKLISINLDTSCGIPSFDSALTTAVNTGAWDKNPPANAALDDELIHFVFEAKTWATRGGSTMERRWLLLGTGLL